MLILLLTGVPARAATPGTQKWAFSTGGYVGFSSPAIGPDGSIYLGSYDKKLYAVNQDGTAKWSFATGNFIESSPAVAPDGTQKWAFTTGAPVESSPALGTDGTI